MARAGGNAGGGERGADCDDGGDDGGGDGDGDLCPSAFEVCPCVACRTTVNMTRERRRRYTNLR